MPRTVTYIHQSTQPQDSNLSWSIRTPRPTSSPVHRQLRLVFLPLNQQPATPTPQAARMLEQQVCLALIHVSKDDDVFRVGL